MWSNFAGTAVDTKVNHCHAQGCFGSSTKRMTATDLSRLADILEEDSIPGWLRDEIDRQSQAILLALEGGRSFTLKGPRGEQIIIGPIEGHQFAV